MFKLQPRKMMLAVLTVLSLLCACHAQNPVTDCSQLGFGAGAPFTGNYPLCGDLGGNQCCTPDYLTMTAETAAEMAFRDALREELEDDDREYSTINTNLTQYLTVQFINRMAVSFPFSDQLDSSSLGEFSNELSESFVPNLVITDSDTFSVEEYVNTIVNRLSALAATRLSAGGADPSTQLPCITRVIREGVNDNVKTLLADAIQTIRQSASALARIQSFLGSYKQTLVRNFTPVSGCVKRLAQLSFCGRCTRRLPPLCRGSCNAMVRGCLSPVYSAFRRDFRQLWNVSRAIVSNLENTIRGFYAEQGQIITSYLDTLQQLVTQCGISVPTFPTSQPPVTGSPMGKRSSEDDDDDDEDRRLTFNSLREILDDFDGLFDYDDEGPDFCEPMSREEDYCEDEGRDPTADRSCEVNEICTSECRCWNGTHMRETNTEFFRGNGVMEQENNPAVDGLVEDLIAQANEIGAATPANAFLRSEEFNAVVPEGIEIPMAEPFTGSSGAVRMMVSLFAMLISTLVGLIL